MGGAAAPRRALHAALLLFSLLPPLALGASVVPAAAGARPAAHVSIVNGTPISIAQAPWQVDVRSMLPDEGGVEVRCGGSILDATHVLTAAHCVFDSATSQPIPPGEMDVMAGTSNIDTPEPGTQDVGVASVRSHPYYVEAPASRSEPDQDDVAVLTLSEPLVLGGKVQQIGLAALGGVQPEGLPVAITGFGEQVANTPSSGVLYGLGMTLAFARRCGGASDAVFLCASAPGGSSCFGDSGSGLTSGASLIGALSFGLTRAGEDCTPGELHGFANLAAPEIQDFVEGSEAPPRAPRGGGPVLGGTATTGGALSCQPGSWSGEATFAYVFMDAASGQVLQGGASSSYQVLPGDLGRTILCQVQATNAGGTGLDRTAPSAAVVAGATPALMPARTRPAAVLVGSKLVVEGGKVVLLRIACKGTQVCRGALTLLARHTGRVRGHRKGVTRTVTIGTVKLLLAAGAGVTVRVQLNATGHALMAGAHGSVAARLTLAEATTPGARTLVTQGYDVRLVARANGHRPHKR